MKESGNYAPSTEFHPDAPWNQEDPTESAEFEAEQLRQWDERIMDVHGYFLESLSEADDSVLTVLARMVRDNQNGTHTEAIGAVVTDLVTAYCKPDDEEIIEELRDSAEYAADMAAEARYEARKERENEV